MNRDELLNIRNFGPVCLKRVEAFLASEGRKPVSTPSKPEPAAYEISVRCQAVGQLVKARCKEGTVS
jgi:hypothetical protein